MAEAARSTAADRVGSIESNGINPIPDAGRHGRARDLFWVWFSANYGIPGIVFGAILASFGINLWQAIVATLLALLVSFGLVGVLSLAGVWSGAPTLTLSRATFGPRGNQGPALVSWAGLVGWEVLVAILGAYAVSKLFVLAGLPASNFWTVVSLGIVAACVMVVSVLGHATIVWLQRIATVMLVILTAVLIPLLLRTTDWHAAAAAPAGPWDSGFLAAASIIAAATGFGWVNAAADYTRYLPRRTGGAGIVGWTVAGATVALFTFIMAGFLLSSAVANLAGASGPIATVGSALPSWFMVPYLVTAAVGLVFNSVVNSYSGGLSLMALGLNAQRYKTILIDGALMLAGGIYVMVVAQSFYASFQSFLYLLADGLAAWAGVVLVDISHRRIYDAQGLSTFSSRGQYFYRHGVNVAALVSWIAGGTVAVLLTATPTYTGPWARGIFGTSSLGFFVGMLISAALYSVAIRLRLVGSARPASYS